MSRFTSTVMLFVYGLVAGPTMYGQGWDRHKALAPSVVVDMGTPQVWTLEEAHYLLERNRAYDLGLREQDPSPLNPNQTAGVRLQALSTLLSASVQLDQSIGAKNNAALSLFHTQMAQYQSEFNQRATLYAELNANQANLNIAMQQLNALQSATPVNTQAVTQQQAVVANLNNVITGLNSQISSITTALATPPVLPSLTTSIPADETSQSALGDNSTFDSLLKSFNTGPAASQLSASQQLDNYVNMQYEMVAKQLTLLRDEVGPNRRVIFLELPHSIYVTDKVHLYPYLGGIWGSHLVQSWWAVGGALRVHPLNLHAIQDGAHRAPTLEELGPLSAQFDTFAANATARLNDQITELNKQLNALSAVSCDDEEIRECIARSSEVRSAASCKTTEDLTQCAKNRKQAKIENLKERAVQVSAAKQNSELALGRYLSRSGPNKATPAFLGATAAAFAYSDDPFVSPELSFESWAANWIYGAIDKESGEPGSITAPIYTLDLIPRQSSLNVTEAYTSTHQYGFAGLFGWLSGLGARARYERQSQQFSQFTQIENYATGFGKGNYTFGWTFGPNPGTKEIAAGLRTTYAVLVIPKDVRAIRLDAIGCGYRRRDVPRNPFLIATAAANQHMLDSEDCGKMQTFDLDIPDGDDDFWISNARFTPVPAGQRVTLAISGRFGDQTGILVNGTPLQRVPSIAQPMLTTPGYSIPANAGDSGIQGVFEIVHTRNPQDASGADLIASFSMAPAFTGTPTITIVSAARQKTVNDVPCPGSASTSTLLDDNCQMFSRNGPQGPMFFAMPAITRIDADYPVLVPAGPSNQVVVKIVGRGFVESSDTTVVIGSTTLRARANKGVPPAQDTEFEVLPGGTMIQATLSRNRFFPLWSIDYVSTVHGQVTDVNATRDDSVGPPYITACKYTEGKASNGSTPISVTIAGDFFSSSVAPAITADGSSDSKAVTGLSATLKGTREWDVAVSIPSATTTVAVAIAPAIPSYKQTFLCTGPPANKPGLAAAKKGKKPAKKAASGQPTPTSSKSK